MFQAKRSAEAVAKMFTLAKLLVGDFQRGEYTKDVPGHKAVRRVEEMLRSAAIVFTPIVVVRTQATDSVDVNAVPGNDRRTKKLRVVQDASKALPKLLRHGIYASGAGVHVGKPGDGDGADIRGRLLRGFDAARHLERVVELRLVLFAQVLEVRRLLVLLLQLARQLPGFLLELGRALLRGEQASRGGCGHLICRATAQLG